MSTNKYKNNSQNFLQTYEREIAPRLKKIDITIKSNYPYIPTSEVYETLEISETELKEIMESLNIEYITKNDFYKIMQKGSSYICKLFQKEIDCGAPSFYSADDISYIYNIDKKEVENVCNFMGIKKISSSSLPAVFSQIFL